MFNVNESMKDKRIHLHQSEQKKRREEVLFKLRKKFIHPQTPKREDMQHIKNILDEFCIASISSREGRTKLKQVIQLITQKPYEYQFQITQILSISSTLLQMPINENTISLIYDTLKMLINLNQSEQEIMDDVWKLMGASLKYINQQHGYLLIKSCLILIGNSFSEHDSIEYLNRPQCIESMFVIVYELLHTMDRGTVQETLWMLNNLHEVSRFNEQLHSRVVCSLVCPQWWDLTSKLVERYADDQDFMKELLWLVYLITKSNPSHQSHNLVTSLLPRLNIEHEKTLLITLMVITQLSSKGYIATNLVSDLMQTYIRANCFSQREIIVCLSNLFVTDQQSKSMFLGNHHWEEILFHSLQFYLQDTLYLLYNLITDFNMGVSLVKMNTEIVAALTQVLHSTNVPENMVQTFNQLIF